MLHGHYVSVGCYAMGDDAVEEIYVLMWSALAAGQAAITVHAFPFRLTDNALAVQAEAEWHDFWEISNRCTSRSSALAFRGSDSQRAKMRERQLRP